MMCQHGVRGYSLHKECQTRPQRLAVEAQGVAVAGVAGFAVQEIVKILQTRRRTNVGVEFTATAPGLYCYPNAVGELGEGGGRRYMGCSHCSTFTNKLTSDATTIDLRRTRLDEGFVAVGEG